MLKVVETDGTVKMDLDELAREGARRMIAAALEAEVEAYVDAHREARDQDGRALVTRNGRARPRTLTTGVGAMEVRAPRVNDRRVNEAGERERFSSAILPRYARRSPKVDDVLPLLYLRGLSTSDFQPALESFLGEEAAGLSPAAIVRLKAKWEDEYTAWKGRDLAGQDFVYVWVDGVYFNVRLEEERICALVVLGVKADGTKELVALDDGYRESKESWLTVLRDLKKRGMKSPMLAVGDGALGFWGAAAEVWPETQQQRCWVHKIANVLDRLPKGLQPRAKRALHDIMNAETRKAAEKGFADFEKEWSAKYPKVVETLRKDQASLTAFLDFPAEHWAHLRTTNAIESTFATVRLRTRSTKGAGSRRAGLAMAFKLMKAAELRYRALTGRELVAAVRAGSKFKDGVRAADAA